MEIPDFFFNDAGRLRCLWRLAVFAVAYLMTLTALFLATDFGLAFFLSPEMHKRLLVESNWAFVIQSFVYFLPAALVGWGCAYVLEDLPWRALGWALHWGWSRDLLKGLLVGAASLSVAAAVGAALGGIRFSVPARLDALAAARTFVSSGLIFMLGAAAEELTFRGYALQTAMRSWPLLLALVPTSAFFALVHLDNPNVAPGFTFANTLLAGALLAVSYWRTRSLWFPFGVHWGWNWVQGAILGSPVSGITQIAHAPLLHFSDTGPAWIGGGLYGIEGGAACTLALILSTLFIWRTRLVSATQEMRRFTDGEIPNSSREAVSIRGDSDSRN
jgi:membrane protease YdiL (CAAX protease family)